VGVVQLEAWYGRRSEDKTWGFPVREYWGVDPQETLSPGLRDRLAFLVTATGTYEEAAAVARKMDLPGDDSTLHALTQRLGKACIDQMELDLSLPEETPPLPPTRPTAEPTQGLVVMMDGWMARYRGDDWGADPKIVTDQRVQWHEVKTAVAYRIEQSVQVSNRRGLLTEKASTCYRGEPFEFGRRAKHAARRRGLSTATAVTAVADGAPWIWNLVKDQFPGAVECLDFYHASQHLWALSKARWGEGHRYGKTWVKSLLHELRHGDPDKVMNRILKLTKTSGLSLAAREELQKEINYFESNRTRLNYANQAARGWPIGSGAVESACRQLQCRFKRAGQFWSRAGFDHLAALRAARDNGLWDKVLFPNS